MESITINKIVKVILPTIFPKLISTFFREGSITLGIAAICMQFVIQECHFAVFVALEFILC